MGDLRITCVVRDETGEITHVGIGAQRFAVEAVIAWICSGTHTFYMREGDVMIRVHACEQDGRWVLECGMGDLGRLPECRL